MADEGKTSSTVSRPDAGGVVPHSTTAPPPKTAYESLVSEGEAAVRERDFEASLRCFRRALALAKEQHGECGPEVARCLLQQSVARLELRTDVEQAKFMLRAAQKAAAGENSAESEEESAEVTVMALRHLASVHAQACDESKFQTCMERASFVALSAPSNKALLGMAHGLLKVSRGGHDTAKLRRYVACIGDRGAVAGGRESDYQMEHDTATILLAIGTNLRTDSEFDDQGVDALQDAVRRLASLPGHSGTLPCTIYSGCPMTRCVCALARAMCMSWRSAEGVALALSTISVALARDDSDNLAHIARELDHLSMCLTSGGDFYAMVDLLGRFFLWWTPAAGCCSPRAFVDATYHLASSLVMLDRAHELPRFVRHAVGRLGSASLEAELRRFVTSSEPQLCDGLGLPLPRTHEWRERAALSIAKSGQHDRKALKALNRVLGESPQDYQHVWLHAKRAKVLSRLGRDAGAAAAADKALCIARELGVLGALCANNGEDLAAIANAFAAVDRKDDSAYAFRLAGHAVRGIGGCMHSDKYPQAALARCYDKAAEVAPWMPDNQIVRARAFVAMGSISEAIDAYQHARQLAVSEGDDETVSNVLEAIQQLEAEM